MNEYIKEIEEIATKCSCSQSDGYAQIMRICEAIKEQHNDWIPCSERLPEEHDSIFAEYKGTDKWRSGMFEKISNDVNATIEYENGTRKTKTIHTVDGVWKIDSIVKGEVIAWQPLPAPYKEGE